MQGKIDNWEKLHPYIIEKWDYIFNHLHRVIPTQEHPQVQGVSPQKRKAEQIKNHRRMNGLLDNATDVNIAKDQIENQKLSLKCKFLRSLF